MIVIWHGSSTVLGACPWRLGLLCAIRKKFHCLKLEFMQYSSNRCAVPLTYSPVTTYLGRHVFLSKMGLRLDTAARHPQQWCGCILQQRRAVIVREIRLPRADPIVKTHHPDYLNTAVFRPCPALLGGIIRTVLPFKLPGY